MGCQLVLVILLGSQSTGAQESQPAPDHAGVIAVDLSQASAAAVSVQDAVAIGRAVQVARLTAVGVSFEDFERLCARRLECERMIEETDRRRHDADSMAKKLSDLRRQIVQWNDDRASEGTWKIAEGVARVAKVTADGVIAAADKALARPGKVTGRVIRGTYVLSQDLVMALAGETAAGTNGAGFLLGEVASVAKRNGTMPTFQRANEVAEWLDRGGELLQGVALIEEGRRDRVRLAAEGARVVTTHDERLKELETMRDEFTHDEILQLHDLDEVDFQIKMIELGKDPDAVELQFQVRNGTGVSPDAWCQAMDLARMEADTIRKDLGTHVGRADFYAMSVRLEADADPLGLWASSDALLVTGSTPGDAGDGFDPNPFPVPEGDRIRTGTTEPSHHIPRTVVFSGKGVSVEYWSENDLAVPEIVSFPSTRPAGDMDVTLQDMGLAMKTRLSEEQLDDELANRLLTSALADPGPSQEAGDLVSQWMEDLHQDVVALDGSMDRQKEELRNRIDAYDRRTSTTDMNRDQYRSLFETLATSLRQLSAQSEALATSRAAGSMGFSTSQPALRKSSTLSDTYRQAAAQYRWAAGEERARGNPSKAAEYEALAQQEDRNAARLGGSPR